jgi:hypothetical protein
MTEMKERFVTTVSQKMGRTMMSCMKKKRLTLWVAVSHSSANAIFIALYLGTY